MFDSIHEGNTIGRAVAVGGFLVIRVGMIFLWCVPPGRIIPASGLPGLCGHHRRGGGRLGHVAACRHHRRSVLAWAVVLTLIEMVGPIIAERGREHQQQCLRASRRLLTRCSRCRTAGLVELVAHPPRTSAEGVEPVSSQARNRLSAVREVLGRAR
jgi:hypothetical protein